MGNNENNNNNNEKEEKPRVIVHWNTTQFKPTVYDIETFRLMKQKPKGSGAAGGSTAAIGYSRVYNPNTDSWESPASIDILPPRRKKGEAAAVVVEYKNGD